MKPARSAFCALFGLLCCAFVLSIDSAVGAEASGPDVVAQTDRKAYDQLGFDSLRSVEGELNATADRQHEGLMSGFKTRKDRLKARTGLTYGIDNIMHYLASDAARSPSDAASNVTRFYGTWTASGPSRPWNGALVFKLEYRTAVGGHIPTQSLGPSLGYAGLFASTYSDAGLILTNLYWRNQFAAGRGSLVVGQVDTYDYVNVNNIASPWTGFTNLAFEQQPTFAGPSQGLGAAVLWRLNDNWTLLGGFSDANADPSDPLDSVETLFDTGETFKHLAVGWSPDWSDRYDRLVQLTFWQIDAREDAGVEAGHGVAIAASVRLGQWRPFLRAGYAEDGGVLLDHAVTMGFGRDARGGKDLAGLAVNWGRAPDISRDQYTLEGFYRYDVTGFLQLTPSIQYVANPADDPETDDILVFGLRLRAHL